MARHESYEEQRDEVIAELTEKHLARRRALVRDGDKKTVVDVANDVLDQMAAEHISELVIESQHAARAVIGKKFVNVVTKVLTDHAEADAIREVEALERAAKDDPDNCRPKGRRMVQWMQEQEERF